MKRIAAIQCVPRMDINVGANVSGSVKSVMVK